MKPAPFRYHRPGSLAEALALLSQLGDAKLIAGGQSLAPMMNMRLVSPAALIDLNGIAGLDGISERNGFVEIGALARHHAVANSSVVKTHCPLLAQAAGAIGHYAIRARGTLGGSLAHADPAAQLPLVAATLNAEIVLAGKRGERRIAARDFFVSLMSTALAPDEIIVAARFPKSAPRERCAYTQFSRRTGDFALVGVACTLGSDGLTLGIGGVEDKPLVFADFGTTDAASVAHAVRERVSPAENPRVPAVFRKELVEILTRRAIQQCTSSN
ncbi:MAG TPA: xanthine dehydrogenase family protein subunit M [Burkholderiales bacterium]|nr:xanthine dehydrogenase family protein subunit M [Burkholderiales bacterium]